MANRTVKDAHTIKGTNPQYLVEKIIRSRIYESKYWKEHCFALSAELLVDKAMELKYIGGVFGGNIKPAPFLCLTLKMLQIQPEKDIIVEFIRNEDFKYVRALGAFYMRLTGNSLDCYKYLEPLYNDYRKIKLQQKTGEFLLSHMDEFIDDLLREERVNDVILPRLQKRNALEESNQLDPRISALEDDMDEGDISDEDELMKDDTRRNGSPDRGHKDRERSRHSPSSKRRRSRSPHRKRRSRSRERDRKHHHGNEKSRDRRHRSRSRERKDKHSRHDDDERRKHRKKSKHEHRDRDKDKDKITDKSDKYYSADPEIAEANALRKKLGMPPLKE